MNENMSQVFRNLGPNSTSLSDSEIKEKKLHGIPSPPSGACLTKTNPERNFRVSRKKWGAGIPHPLDPPDLQLKP
ncbi:Cytoplasmic Polyadenylation Element-Binding Protein 4 [Manis pentadactyla]|nr:Cytoplasmic Polyadenylation Element-Binding Protein 4 [Manis pentadactyla]